MASTVAPAARIIATTMTMATSRLRRSASRPPAPPIPIMAARYLREPADQPAATAPQQGVQRGARGGLPAHLLQPVDVEERGDRGEPVDAVQDRRVLRSADAGVEVRDVVAQDQQPAPGPQPPDRAGQHATVSASGRCR